MNVRVDVDACASIQDDGFVVSVPLMTIFDTELAVNFVVFEKVTVLIDSVVLC